MMRLKMEERNAKHKESREAMITIKNNRIVLTANMIPSFLILTIKRKSLLKQ